MQDPESAHSTADSKDEDTGKDTTESCLSSEIIKLREENVNLKAELTEIKVRVDTSTEELKSLKEELEKAASERQDILQTVETLQSQVEILNSWINENWNYHHGYSTGYENYHDRNQETENPPGNTETCKSDEKVGPEIENDSNVKEAGTKASSNVLLTGGVKRHAVADPYRNMIHTRINNQSASVDLPGCGTTDESKNDENEMEIDNLMPSSPSIDQPEEDNRSVASILKETAEQAIAQSGMGYDPTSGLYYDWNTHLYYDPKTHLFYDSDNGIYYYYDNEKKSYLFYSQVETPKCDEVSAIAFPKGENKGDEKSEGEITSEDEENKDYAPCIRAIVVASDSLKLGSLYLITCKGATIGRDKNKHLLCIPETEASKNHAEITYKENKRHYVLKDMASANGTFLNDRRLSKPGNKSKSKKLNHKDYLKIGSTRFVLHIHRGQETCGECEPGQVQALLSAKSEEGQENISKQELRKREIKNLKRKYQIAGDGLAEAMAPITSGKYKDRASDRRHTVGSEPIKTGHVIPVTATSTTKHVSQDNIGHKMLEKMGWKAGEGLGRKGTGIKEPVNVLVHEKNKGLGHGSLKSLDDPEGRASSHKWTKAKQRYDNIVQDEQNAAKDI